LANPLRVHVSHQQTVLQLPIGARRLAWSDRDQHQAFRVGDFVWGVQFHPEFNAAAVRAYTEDDRAVLIADEQNPDRISAQIEDTPYGTDILRRFARLALRQFCFSNTRQISSNTINAVKFCAP
jgi:GMP synthase (glutamine-hydrolysing)